MQLADVDLYDPDSFVNGVPHEMFSLLRREAPVYKHPRPDGGHFWCVTTHDDVVEVNRDNKTFSSWANGTTGLDEMPAESLEQTRMMMLNMDPPEHTKLRKLVNKGFTPRMVRELQNHLEEEANAIVAAAVERGEFEFVTDVACELPLIAIAEFLGVPREERKVIFDLSNRLIGFDDPDFQTTIEDAGIAAMDMFAFAQELADRKRANPGNDIASTLLQAEVDGERLNEIEFNVFFMLLAVAGNETTRNAISHGMLALLEHPDQWRVLKDNPALLDEAIEEILRWASPVMYFRRTPTRDVVLSDTTIPEGDAIVMWHMSANRDETVFDDPFTFDIRRSPNLHTLHVAFGGGGPHFCLGANLARAEMKVIFQALIDQVETAELAGEARRLRSNFINGIKEMPVRVTPA